MLEPTMPKSRNRHFEQQHYRPTALRTSEAPQHSCRILSTLTVSYLIAKSSSTNGDLEVWALTRDPLAFHIVNFQLPLLLYRKYLPFEAGVILGLLPIVFGSDFNDYERIADADGVNTDCDALPKMLRWLGDSETPSHSPP